MAGPQPAVDLGDLAFELVDQPDRGGDVRAPGLGHLQPLEQTAAFGPEEIGHRAGAAEVDQRRVDAVLERRLVLDKVEPEASELALFANARVGEPDRRHQVAMRERREDERVGLVGL